ncbi:MAG: zinc-finger domain-containing protein [Alphaproteobacteria bacterium]|nr:MAG: zinc-finger domain-containing protein [Alphaproteobacteria bacterium]
MSIPPPETIYVEDKVVACDGGEGALGHPRVFLNIGDAGTVECPYCDRLFILAGGPKDNRGSKSKKPKAA